DIVIIRPGHFTELFTLENEAWPACLGSHGRGKINENGQRLLEMCCSHSLCVTNTFFKCKEIHQVSWRHPRSCHWHKLDLVITRRVELASVLLTRSYHSADCDMDHSLVASKIRIIPKKLHHAKKKGCPRIKTCCTSNPEKTQQFICKLHEALTKETPDDTIDSKWSHLQNAVYNSAITAYGKKESKNTDWYEANWEEIKPVTEAKRKALLAYKAVSSLGTLQALRTARKNAARHCANTYWLDLCTSIEIAAETGDARGMYEGIKKATGPSTSKIVPLKSKIGEVIKDQGHHPRPASQELRKAIDCLACGKAPGSDGILPEALKIGKPALLQPLHKLFCLC
ncbi:craniofacial development protein 2, partial [Tachysurus ichikawai]